MRKVICGFSILFILNFLLFGCAPAKGVDPNAPITYVNFDEKDDNDNYFDVISGNALYAKGVVESVDGVSGKAARFDGESSLELSTFSGIEGNEPFTLSATIKAKASNFVVTNDYTIIGIGEANEFANAKIGSHYGKLCMYYVDKYAYIDFPHDSATNWHTFTLTYDGEKFHFFLDGVEKQSSRVREGMKLTKTSLFIGGYMNNSETFIGDIDNVMVFKKALTDKEIKNYMNMDIKIDEKEPNNIVPTSEDGSIFTKLVESFKLGQWTETKAVVHGVTLPFAIHLPSDFSSEKTYRLLLFLHGDGSVTFTPKRIITAGECTAVTKSLRDYPDTICLIPASPVSWISITNLKQNGFSRNFTLDRATPTNYLLATISLVEGLMEPLHIDSQKIHFQGVSRGCMAGWYLLYKYPNFFASALMVQGTGLIDEEAIIQIAKTPTWMLMSQDDQLVSYNDFETLYNLLVAEGADTRLSTYSGYDHFGTNAAVYNEEDLLPWLYSYPKQV